MQTIPEAEVQAGWRELNLMDRTEASQLARRMQEEQPYILVYLLAAEETEGNREDPGRLMEMGACIWSIMNHAGGPLATIGPDQLDAAENENLRFLDRLDEGSEAEFTETLNSMLTEYNQVPLLRHVVDVLMGHLAEEDVLVGEGPGLALLRLKTVIDCLDRVAPAS